MRFFVPLIALALAASPALAQTPSAASGAGTVPSAPVPSASTPAPGGASQANPPARQTRRLPLQQRFEAANTTHDGHLTLEQARAGLPHVARHFNKIDKGGKGYDTLE